MFEKLIHLLGGYTDADMNRKYLEGRMSQANRACEAIDDCAHLIGAAYKVKVRSLIHKMLLEESDKFHTFVGR